ncbi:hypothetical protein ACFY4C_11185 [Actinomadura viridis]|uniref:hypothetical protein n=1 Tax=Actinomadura viridis TaxID=58110 RepID=UPI00369753C4
MTAYTSVVSGETTITARGPVRAAAERTLGRLWIDRVPVRLASEDPELWPSSAQAAQEGRTLCWPGQPGTSRAVLERIGELRAAAEEDGLTEVALLGRGTPARAADLIVRYFGTPSPGPDATQPDTGPGATQPGTTQPGTTGPEAASRPGGPALTVLDGLEAGLPLRIGRDRERLRRTLVVVTGYDPVTDTLRRIFVRMFGELGLAPEEIARRFVVVAPPGGLPAKKAADAGHALIDAPEPTAFGALSPYALVPAGLAGADVAALLEEATAVLPSLTRPENNPGLVLGAILGGAVRDGRETVVLGGYPALAAGTPGPGLADWAAPLLAEATGGRLLPLVQNGGRPVVPADDLFLVTVGGRPRQDDATISGPPAAQFVVWEYAAAVTAYLLGVDPLRPPDPDPGEAAPEPAVFVDGDPGQAVEVHTSDPGFAAAPDLPALLEAVVRRAATEGHLAIVAHLDPDPGSGQGALVGRLAAVLAARCARPVTVDWGRRRPATGNDRREKGVYLMMTGNADQDVPIEGRYHWLSLLQVARALGEVRAAVREGGRPVVRLHLRDRRAGLARLLESARGGA